MAIYFFDSSALVKRYIAETGTVWVRGITDPAAGNGIYVARITEVETVAALTRRKRKGDLTPGDAAAAIADVRVDFAAEYAVIEVAPVLIADAVRLAETHALRGYDAVQLAAALRVGADSLAVGLPPVTLISADSDLNDAGRAEGLLVDDPNTH